MASLADVGPVLVTGAGGFIGGHVMRRLRSRGAAIVASTRDGKEGTRALDLRRPEGFGAALAGINAVVHCAVGDREVTVDGTRGLLAAAAAASVRRFVHLSSMAVYGDASGRVDESTPMQSGADGYGAWKVEAEQACLAQTGLEVVRLRPTIVYGQGGSYWLDSMVERVRSGRWGDFGAAGAGTCNLVHVDDVVDAIEAALTGDGAPGHAFNVNGPETTSWNGYFSSLALALGQKPLREVSPLALKIRMFTSLLLKVVGKVRPGLVASLLQGVPGRSDLALFARRATYPTDAARAVMGWTPTVGIAEGLARSLHS